MRRTHTLVLAALLLGAPAPERAGATDQKKAAGAATQLFNGKNLSGWYTFLRNQGQDNDPEGVFKVEDGLIHVSGKTFGYIMTEKEYENYHLVVEFKWGKTKWPPRENAVRDSGILYHVIGPDKVWPKSFECQIQEGDTGDFWLIDGVTLTTPDRPTDDGKPRKNERNKNRIIKYKDAERPSGEWNVVEVIADGNTVKHVVNGVLTNEGTNLSHTRGKILLQSEGAEVFYRKIELRPLKAPAAGR